LGQGGEMIQTLYAYMNKIKIKKKENKLEVRPENHLLSKRN
jgi:hypothetical protein